MGVVCEVESLQTSEHFAIKFLRQDVETDMHPNARFLREAKLATRLCSPHSCRVVCVGEWELGPYIVMELLSGCALSALLDGGRQLAWNAAVRITYEICDALSEAHQLNIVHRDIKPGNIFLAKQPDHLVATKVLDFGVAKIPTTVVTQHGERSLTDASTVIGTPSYVAPEQLMNSKQVDARADIWAVGVMLYEMLAGQLPFHSPLVPKLLLMIARDEPPPLLNIVPLVPTEVVHIVERCLAKDPSLRYENAEQLAKALEPWLDPRPDLLVELVPQASEPKLDLHLNASDYPDQDHTDGSTVHRKSTDSLGPHTTAGFPKQRRWTLASLKTVSAGALLGALVALSYYVIPKPRPAPSETTTQAAAASNSARAANEGESRRLLIQASPTHATLLLDGVALPMNPFVSTRHDDGHEHALSVEAPGFVREERSLRFDRDQTLTIVLRPIPATLPSEPPARKQSNSSRSVRSPRELPVRNSPRPPAHSLDPNNPF
jgi:serine/threonine-protein kinase